MTLCATGTTRCRMPLISKLELQSSQVIVTRVARALKLVLERRCGHIPRNRFLDDDD